MKKIIILIFVIVFLVGGYFIYVNVFLNTKNQGELSKSSANGEEIKTNYVTCRNANPRCEDNGKNRIRSAERIGNNIKINFEITASCCLEGIFAKNQITGNKIIVDIFSRNKTPDCNCISRYGGSYVIENIKPGELEVVWEKKYSYIDQDGSEKQGSETVDSYMVK